MASEPIVEMNSSGTVTALNIFAPDGLVARQTSSSTTQYVFDQPRFAFAYRPGAAGPKGISLAPLGGISAIHGYDKETPPTSSILPGRCSR